MTRIDADWLRMTATQEVLSLYSDAGHVAYVVGGAVRNTLIGLSVSDIDIATSATPEQGLALAEKAGIRAVPTGIDHGTITLIQGDTPYEITTFRRDVETDGRRAIVAYTDDLVEDAHRRDFTINALYADADGHVIDPVGGLPDLDARRVIFVGDAGARIDEDHLRSLRFFRFYAQYGSPDVGPDPEALAAIAARLDGLNTLARERVGAEMKKLLAAADPAPSLATMAACGALLRVLPGAEPTVIAPLVHLETKVGRAPDWLRRLAAMGGDSPDERFRLSRAEAKALRSRRQHLSHDTPLREIAWRDGADMAWDVLLIRQAALGQGIADGTAALIARAATAEFPLTAADLMPALQGPAIGKAMARAEKLWIDSDFQPDRADLMATLGLKA